MNAVGRVRRKNRVETARDDLTVGPTLSAPRGTGRVARQFGTGFHREAGTGEGVAVVHRGDVQKNLSLNLTTAARSRAERFREGDGVRRAVGDGRHAREFADAENAAARRLRLGGRFVGRSAVVVPQRVAAAANIAQASRQMTVGRLRTRVRVGRTAERVERDTEEGEFARVFIRVLQTRTRGRLCRLKHLRVDLILFNERKQENEG